MEFFETIYPRLPRNYTGRFVKIQEIIHKILDRFPCEECGTLDFCDYCVMCDVFQCKECDNKVHQPRYSDIIF